jgi:hypothetical protein
VAAGFVDLEITWRADVFSGAPQESSAANFGTLGINFRARKALDEEEWAAALAALSLKCPPGPPRLVRSSSSISGRGF